MESATSAAGRLQEALAERYRIERELGAGGMATVYLAEDLRHSRRVAVKVLKPELAAVLGAERFVVEIRTTAQLQHPHILPLFDSGSADGFLYYVMPYVEGETLRSKLDRERQLGIDEAVRITREVADALDYAHRHGVIHRDIKPENILLHDGRPMVADFGIALAVSAAAGGRMTETGLSLGTPHYMSPEQATAEKEITGRSDIYSLASVLYEMLTGQPPHLGGSAQQIIMKIITEQPQDVTVLRRSAPPHVAAAVAKALEKLPADRFAGAREFAAALDDAAAPVGRPPPSPARVRPAPRPATLLWPAAALLFAAFGLWGWLRSPPRPETSRQRVTLWRHTADPFLAPGIGLYATRAAIAPDGSSIVFYDSVGGAFQLFRKRRGDAEAVPLAGTAGAVSPFFSPDGEWIGYVTVDGRLRKVPVNGGGAITLSEGGAGVSRAAAWMDDGTIISVIGGDGVQRIPADGGASRPVGDPTRWPPFNEVVTIAPLPGSRGFLYTACVGNCAYESGVHVFDLAADSGRLLVANAAGAWYAPTGHLLYIDRAGGLFAAPFDPRRLEVTGGAVPVIENVAPASLVLSASGAALYTLGSIGAATELVWVSRDGTAVPVDGDWRADFSYPALSPDGRTLAVSVTDGPTHLWIRRADGARQKLTQDGSMNWRPVWTPDGQSVTFASDRGGRGPAFPAIYGLRVDGSAPATLLLSHEYGLWEGEISRDGQWLVVRADEPALAAVRARRMTGDTALIPVAARPGGGLQIALSPDGRWLAYSSGATGRNEVYVTSFPEATVTRLVSRDGGTEPRWAHSGRELFYKRGDRLMVVDVIPGATFATGNPRPLFSVAGYRSARNRQQYDVSADGQRFVMIRNVESAEHEAVVYVENWFAELRERVKR